MKQVSIPILLCLLLSPGSYYPVRSVASTINVSALNGWNLWEPEAVLAPWKSTGVAKGGILTTATWTEFRFSWFLVQICILAMETSDATVYFGISGLHHNNRRGSRSSEGSKWKLNVDCLPQLLVHCVYFGYVILLIYTFWKHCHLNRSI